MYISYIHIYTYMYNITYIIQLFIHTYTVTCIHYIHTHVHINTYIHMYTHTYTHTYVQTYIHTYTHTYIHTYICTHTYTYIHNERDVAPWYECLIMERWVVGSILHGGTIELFLVPASAPRLVYQRPWYVLSCLWDSAYKRTLAANWKE